MNLNENCLTIFLRQQTVQKCDIRTADRPVQKRGKPDNTPDEVEELDLTQDQAGFLSDFYNPDCIKN